MPKRMSMQFRQTCHVIRVIYENNKREREKKKSTGFTNKFSVAQTVGKLVIGNRGIVRRIISLGPRYLPKLFRKDQEIHFQGSYFTMLFDSSPSVQNELTRILKNDPRVLRSTIFKVPTKKNLNAKSAVDAVREAAL